MDLTMKIPSIILVLFLTFIRLDIVSGVSSCVGCTSFYQAGSSKIPNSQGCIDTNSSVISRYASYCDTQFAPNYYLSEIVGCQSTYILGADKKTLEKVTRGCVVLEGYSSYGVTPDIARTPAGMCFIHPTLSGTLTCVCASRDDCNVYPFIGKDSSGKFVATALQPDANGNIIPGSSAADITDPVRSPPKISTNSNSNSNTNSNPNTNMVTANGNVKAGSADDQSNVAASGTNANGSQDSTGGAMKNSGKISRFVLGYLFVSTLGFELVMF